MAVNIMTKLHNDLLRDIGTLARTRKKSFWWYKKVIASNGEDLE
jgi:beta-glucosidase/6-phospho-beta-glucosidase/beta-galactosidase